MHWCLCQRLLVLVAVTGGGVIAVLAGVLAVALVAVSLVLLLGVWRADSLCRYIQPYGSADIYSHTAVQIYTVIRQCRYIQSYGRDPELAASINTARTYCYCTPVFPDHHPVSDTRVHHA